MLQRVRRGNGHFSVLLDGQIVLPRGQGQTRKSLPRQGRIGRSLHLVAQKLDGLFGFILSLQSLREADNDLRIAWR